MNYCGIDIGTHWMGYAVVNPDKRIMKSGWYKLESKEDRKLRGWEALTSRLIKLDTYTRWFFSKLSHVKYVGIEHPFVLRNVQTAITLGIAFGYVASAAQECGFNIVKIEAGEAKKALTGNGKATKGTMIATAKVLGACKGRGKGIEDEADAIGVAFATLIKCQN